MGSLPLAMIVIRTIEDSTAAIEGEIKVEDVHDDRLAVPKGHHTAGHLDNRDDEDKLGYDEKEVPVSYVEAK